MSSTLLKWCYYYIAFGGGCSLDFLSLSETSLTGTTKHAAILHRIAYSAFTYERIGEMQLMEAYIVSRQGW